MTVQPMAMGMSGDQAAVHWEATYAARTRPESGMFVWVTLPNGVNSGELLRRALAEAGVAFVPGTAFFAGGCGRNTLRLSYTLRPEAASREGMRRLGGLVSRVLAHGGRRA